MYFSNLRVSADSFCEQFPFLHLLEEVTRAVSLHGAVTGDQGVWDGFKGPAGVLPRQHVPC